ncbi:unnamed protein product [Symbiodinium sp. CCMP2592]|nr:unnamed protein product [Symbiodinium sp. CCMP2592]
MPGPTLLLRVPNRGSDPKTKSKKLLKPVELRSLNTSGLEVELAASARGLAGFAGYHTSVLIDGEEYYFSPTGIRYVKKLMSHPRRSQATRTHIGFSKATGQQMLDFLNEHFLAGSYDFLRKNCNSFTDAALYFLCEARLDFKYRAMETIGWMAESSSTGGLCCKDIQQVSH